MVITESKLRTVIREELINYLNEDKEVFEEGKLTNLILGALGMISTVGGMGGVVSMANQQSPRSVMQATVVAENIEKEAKEIIEENKIECDKQGNFTMNGEAIGKLSEGSLQKLKELYDMGYVSNSGGNPVKIDKQNSLKAEVEKDVGYAKLSTNLQKLKGVQTDQQTKNIKIFAIILMAGVMGLLGSAVGTVLDPENSRGASGGGGLMRSGRPSASQLRRTRDMRAGRSLNSL
jgi:hypothetical protein